MKNNMKKLLTFSLTGAMLLSGAFTSFAGWEQQVDGAWKYSNNGAYLTGWQWLDGNNDGVAECYYLDGNGIMAVNTTVDSYMVNESGAWVVNGVVQTKVVGSGGQTSNSNSVGHQNQSGIPSLDDITGNHFGNLDGDVQAGDSTGLPPMQAGTGNNSGFTVPPLSSGNVGGLDWTAECGDNTGLPPME